MSSTNMVLEKFRTLRPITDDQTVMAMLAILVNLSREQQRDMWFADKDSGRVCLFRHGEFPGKVLEYVWGTKDDSVSTLYEEHPIFATRQALINARKEVRDEIGRLTLSLPSTIVVGDAGRGRDAYLYELGTAQMIDTLEHFAKPKSLILT